MLKYGTDEDKKNGIITCAIACHYPKEQENLEGYQYNVKRRIFRIHGLHDLYTKFEAGPQGGLSFGDIHITCPKVVYLFMNFTNEKDKFTKFLAKCAARAIEEGDIKEVACQIYDISL